VELISSTLTHTFASIKTILNLEEIFSLLGTWRINIDKKLSLSINNQKCHAELDSASHPFRELRDPEIVDSELDSGHGSG